MLAERFNAWADIINEDREPLEEVENSIFNDNNNDDASNNDDNNASNNNEE